MTYTEIYTNIELGIYNSKVEYPTMRSYKEGHIFDENKSVKWNKAEVARINAEIAAEKEAYSKANSDAYDAFVKDLKSYLKEEYELGPNADEVAELIYGQAYRDGHSGGFTEILGCASELANYTASVIAVCNKR